LPGFDIRIAPRANLFRAPGQVAFGVLATASHEELERLYAHARTVLGARVQPITINTRLPDTVADDISSDDWDNGTPVEDADTVVGKPPPEDTTQTSPDSPRAKRKSKPP